MQPRLLLRLAFLLTGAGAAANVSGVLLARAFADHHQAAEAFRGMFVLGSGITAVSSAAASIAWFASSGGIGRRAVGVLTAGLVGVCVWYLGLYWPWLVFSSTYA